jgi:hypothetical protein
MMNILFQVGHGTIDASFVGRRLLGVAAENDDQWNLASAMTEFDSWNHTANPCGLLATSYTAGSHLSITEEAELESCVHARQLGNFTINSLNLTRMVGMDHFLMSFMDFGNVISGRGVLRELLDTTDLLRFIILHSPVARPWLALIR